MKKKNVKYYFLPLLMLAMPFMMKGQSSNGFPKAEKLAVFTDRGIYVTGEEVHFTAFVTKNALPGFSNVLYAEIIEPDGTRITGGKFRMAHRSASGCLEIPPGSITGVYYLRVYTKYMRNLGPNSFAYVSLKIVNPYKIDVLSGNAAAADTSKNIVRNLSGQPFSITTNREIYEPREKVNVAVKTDGAQIQHLCVSVIPESTTPNDMMDLYSKSRQVDLVNFFPENRGISITGTIKDSLTGKPEAGALVNLSIIGKGRTFMGNQTDSTGHFFFSLPFYTGNRDLFIGPENLPGKHPKILVNNDFSVAPVHLPDPAFKLDSAERKATIQMAQNVHVRQFFNDDSLRCISKPSKPEKAFYGKPSYVLNLDQYIQLPTLEDYIHNLSSVIKLMVRIHDGKKFIRVISDQPDMAFLKPLLMVDGVAVDAPGKILAASPRNIARIEVVNVPYVIGDMKYGGIVNIISKRGDFAGIDLPSSGMFLNYGFLSNLCRCSITAPDTISRPDTRNTLYWNPDISINSGKEVHFSFTTADTPGKYAIVLQGIDGNGKPFMKKDLIVVQPKP